MRIPEKIKGILIPSFVNKTGCIGLSLIPMLLVEKHASLGESTLVMGLVKGAALAGVLASGLISDRASPKKALVISFLLSGIGMLALPFAPGLTLLALLAVVSNFGQSMFPSSVQLLIRRSIPLEEQRDSIGWLRSINNLGCITSYLLALVFSGAGTIALFLFDAVSSLGAASIANKTLPEATADFENQPAATGEEAGNYRMFWGVSALVAAFFFLYDLFMTAAAARAKIEFGDAGLSLFSKIMLVNTVLCAVLGLVAVRIFKEPLKAMPLGFAMMITGCAILNHGSHGFYLGTLIATLGEIAFTSMSAFVMISLLPKSPRAGRIYGVATLLQTTGKMIGASLAFWWIQSPKAPWLLVGGAAFGLVAGVIGFLPEGTLLPLKRSFRGSVAQWR